jgi:hypothetical protein
LTVAAALAALLIIGVALRVQAFVGIWGTDDAEYARLAHAIATSSYDEFIQRTYVDDRDTPAHWPSRVGNYYPTSVVFRLVGVGEWQLVVYPLLVSTLGILLAFSCGRLLFGTLAGIIAAAIWVVLPVDIVFATVPLPDVPASFLASLGVAVVLFRLHGPRPWPANAFAAGAVAGLCFGASWLTKESVAYLVPFVAILMFLALKRNPKAHAPFWIGVAVASMAVLASEMLAYQLWRGDFLFRLHENERSYGQAREFLFYEGSRFGWPEGTSRLLAVMKRVLLTGPSTIFLESYSLFLPALAVVAAAHGLYWRDKAFIAPALWLGALVLAYNFASASTSSYTPLVLSNSRYLHPIMLPATLLTAGLIAKLVIGERSAEPLLAKERRIWGVALAGLVAISAAYATLRGIRDQPQRSALYETKKVANLVRPTDRLYTDPLTAKVLEFHWRYPNSMSIEDFEEMTPADIRTDSFVLVDKARLDWLRINVGSSWLTRKFAYAGPQLDPVPAEWKAVWANSNATLYRVGDLSQAEKLGWGRPRW